MRALTLHQPWASLVALGKKRVETRGWPTEYRGPLVIHAGKQLPYSYRPFATDAFRDALEQVCEINQYGAPDIKQLPTGCALAVAELVDVRRVMPWGDLDGWSLDERERPFGNYSNAEGQRWGWILEEIKPLREPVPCSGRQRLWIPSAETIFAINDRMELAIR